MAVNERFIRSVRTAIPFGSADGKGYLTTGCWRVYGDITGAKRIFARIRESRQRCLGLFDSGMSFRSAVAAF